MVEPTVRFDSLDPRAGVRSLRFAGHVETVAAALPEEVPALLSRVEAGVQEGLHAAGFLAYEAASAFDRALVTRPPRAGLPLAWFALFRARGEDSAPIPPGGGPWSLGPWRAAPDERGYRAAFARIREFLRAGDTYQVNYTLRLRAPFSGDPRTLYHDLCRAQRGAWCAYLDLGSHVVASASPELFFRWREGELTLRPMKGTRPRGRWREEDEALAAELAGSPKERAENLMIVDLLRNDAGRIARPGSVRVERMFEVERYETVHQMTSTVHARTREGVTLGDLFRALFPCGSVTGAPKVRTMEIIAELETAPRGVYCGAIGYASPGEAEFSVGIRTVVLDRAAGTAELGVGSGITWDSEPEREYRECFEKAVFAGSARPPFRLLETLLFEPGSGFFLLDGHLERLGGSARRFGFARDPCAVLRTLHQAAAGADQALRVRLLLAEDGAAEARAEPLRPLPAVARVALALEPVDSADPMLFHKTDLREPYRRRLAEHPECDDVLLLNERGEVTESTTANVVARLDGRLWTPPLACGLLPGVFRAALLSRGEVAERVLTPADLRRAESLWLVNSVRRWRRAVLE